VQYRSLPAPVQPRRAIGGPWCQPLPALGLAGSLAAATLVSSDPFFICFGTPPARPSRHDWLLGGRRRPVDDGSLRPPSPPLAARADRAPAAVRVRAGLGDAVDALVAESCLHGGPCAALYLEVVLGIFIGFALTRSEVSLHDPLGRGLDPVGGPWCRRRSSWRSLGASAGPGSWRARWCFWRRSGPGMSPATPTRRRRWSSAIQASAGGPRSGRRRSS
jgi:hypothetical protein